MRLTAIAMIRNEADILPDFLGHCAALFDEVLVVDHASTDGTTEILAAAAVRMPLVVRRYAQRPYVQSQLVTALAQEAFARGADWVFPLDADEFPMVAGRDDLLARLPADAAAVLWRWRNLWPLGDHGFAAFDAARDYESLPPDIGTTVKIAIARQVPVLLPGFAIGQGSHNVAGLRDRAGMPAEVGRLAHIPIRSRERFVMKATAGMKAVAETPALPAGSATQWRRAANRPERFDGTDGLARLRRSALAYPAAMDPAAIAEPVVFKPADRLQGLPAALPDAAAVLAREAALAWQPVPGEPWRIALRDDALVLVPR
ncbi:glycosyltransferase family 2 protein [Roseomonas sp. CECT 9278]|uniref:glycosyltransferase family 2 protein n=1 Tax=Roseomonas sp. CECT 9278 TaxID=2845823 RepID=UPI001E646089|nr:glycosyltransferase family 2 protein [Roseomonas sp. CECT 9278]CAH0251369.1 hypothetical protein ROS9278_03153 [Roseomonas sp. CECT 9278]